MDTCRYWRTQSCSGSSNLLINSTKSRTYQGLIGMCFGTVVLPALGWPECHMARAALTVNVHPETTRDDFQVLHAPVAGVPPHARKNLLGIGHDYMVPNTAPWNKKACDGFAGANSCAPPSGDSVQVRAAAARRRSRTGRK